MAEENPENRPIFKKQKKKRKNFLTNAKKYAKKGQMGRGSQIPDELYQYFVGILEAMKKGIEDEEERASLVTNVMERTKEQELNIIGNQLGCRVIELLLPYASAEDLERFMEIVTPDLRKLCASDFSSHVVETILKVACDRATNHLQVNEECDKTENSNETPAKRPKLETKKKKKFKKKHRNNCHDFTVKLCKYALNNLEDFVWDSYANHVLRSALKCLSGITLLPGEKPKISLFIIKNDKPKGIPPHETSINYKVVPEEFKELVLEFANRLSAWPQFKDLPYKNLTSGLLQVLLYATNNVDKKLTKNLVTRLLNESFAPEDWVSNGADDEEKDEDKEFKNKETFQDGEVVAQNSPLPPVFSSEAAVRLLEASLFVSKKKTYTQLYARCFINRLGQLSAMPMLNFTVQRLIDNCRVKEEVLIVFRLLEASLFVSKKKTYTQLYARCFINRLGQLSAMPMLNFTVQRLIDNCRVKEEFEAMLSELTGSFDGILASGNSGVLLALSKTALRLRSGQAAFMNNLEALLECNTPELQNHFPLACLQLKPASSWNLQALDKMFIPVHGAVMLQTLLQFQRPGKALAGLLELEPEILCRVFCDAKGCHVADVVCSSATIGAKSREKIVNKLKGFYQKLALDQYGSRAFEHIFNATPLEQKLRIMAEVSEKSNLLNGTMYGRLIAAKFQVDLFKKSQESWKKAVLKVDSVEL